MESFFQQWIKDYFVGEKFAGKKGYQKWRCDKASISLVPIR